MTDVAEHAEFLLQAGGTLVPGRDLYIERPEDRELLQLLRRGQYVNVLTLRQMGKSSLMVRTMQALRDAGIRTAAIDLAGELGGAGDAEQWFRGLLNRLQRDLRLSLDIGAFWFAHPNDTSGQKLQRFFREIVCSEISGQIVVFLDEIDSTLKFNFTDTLFTSLRGMYNERALIPVYERVTFCLLGVAAPNELIKDRRTTPYNIGTTLELRSFDSARDNLKPLACLLSKDEATGEDVLERVLYWTDGHPFLTIKLCADLLAGSATTATAVDDYVERVFTGLDRVSGDVHFQQILRFIETRLSSGLETLDVYARVLNGQEIKEQPIPAHIDLKLSGLVKRDAKGCLIPQNLIYARLFDSHWVETVIPTKTAAIRVTVARAYRRRLRMAAAASIVALLLAGYFGYNYYSTPPDSIVKGNALSGYEVTVPKDAADLVAILRNIPDAHRIRKLDLSQSRVTDISSLSALTSLDSLDLSRTQISDISPLRSLTNLQNLDLSYTQVTDLSPLQSLTNLQSLNLSVTQVTDLSPLQSLANLQSLNLSRTQISDISPHQSLTSLQNLDISSTKISDISPLRSLTNLQNLYLSGTQVRDISPVHSLTNLQSLNLSGTQVSDISALQNLRKLKQLRLSNTATRNISPLREVINLSWLDLDHTQITDLSTLQHLTQLDVLDLNNTRIADISSLRGLSKIAYLDLSGTQITDISPLVALTNLVYLYLYHTEIKNITPVQNFAELQVRWTPKMRQLAKVEPCP
jgi:Leucine-rich repeat (LRR) protein